jgi:hypothetical protein
VQTLQPKGDLRRGGAALTPPGFYGSFDGGRWDVPGNPAVFVLFGWRMFLAANRAPLRRNMRWRRSAVLSGGEIPPCRGTVLASSNRPAL